MKMNMDHRIAIAAAVALLGAGAHATPLSREAYKAQEVRIEAEYDAAQARCKPLKNNARDVCMEQVRGARDTEMLVCGMSLGYADLAAPVNGFHTPREPVAGFTRWV
jgi:nitroreductase